MRSALFVPADDERKLAKALLSGADALIVDLKDSVAHDAKERARRIAADFLRAAAQGARPRLFVRVNPLDGGLTDDDLDAVMPAAPDGVMLPKSLDGASVQQLGVKLAVREALAGLADGVTRVVAIATESARAVFGLASYRGCSPRLEGLAWGGEDLSADLGAESNRGLDGAYADPYRLARSLTLLGATAADVAPIDAVYTNFRDSEGLRVEAIAARRDGFGAKWRSIPRKYRSSMRSSPRRRSPSFGLARSSPPLTPRLAPASWRSTAKCWTGRIACAPSESWRGSGRAPSEQNPDD